MRSLGLLLLLSSLLISRLEAKSWKRGLAYDLPNADDAGAVSPGVSWWYNWSPHPNGGIPNLYYEQFGMEFIPMLWNDNFNADDVVNFIQSKGIKYFLVLNEPNLVDQANMTPQQAAQIWHKFEDVASRSGAALVGPQITWGTMNGYNDPVQWMDAFYEAYRSQNNGRDPRIDFLGFHWYDYGLSGQLDRLKKYNKAFWVTEMANWHSQNDGAQIDTLQKQEAQMADMVHTCEGRNDVTRYAWFTGRWSPDPHFTSIFSGNGQLTDLGHEYVEM